MGLRKGVDARDISVTIANCYVISKMSLFVLFSLSFSYCMATAPLEHR